MIAPTTTSSSLLVIAPFLHLTPTTRSVKDHNASSYLPFTAKRAILTGNISKFQILAPKLFKLIGKQELG